MDVTKHSRMRAFIPTVLPLVVLLLLVPVRQTAGQQEQCPITCLNGGSCIRTLLGQWICECSRSYYGSTCELYNKIGPNCSRPLLKHNIHESAPLGSHRGLSLLILSGEFPAVKYCYDRSDCVDGDPEETSSLEYAIVANNSDAFEIKTDSNNSRTCLYLNRRLDYESLDAVNHQIVLNISVREPRPPHRKAYFLHELTVLDVDEVAAFTADRYDARLLRNAPVGTEVLRVTAVDPDNSSTPYGQVRYGIAESFPSEGYFNINTTTGVISVRTSLTSSASAKFGLVIEAKSDPKGLLSATVPVRINVQEVCQEGFQFTLDQAAPDDTTIGDLQCKTTYGPLTFSTTAVEAMSIYISPGTGIIRLDHLKYRDAGQTYTFNVNVSTSLEPLLMINYKFTITITENSPPVCSTPKTGMPSIQLSENSTTALQAPCMVNISATCSDADDTLTCTFTHDQAPHFGDYGYFSIRDDPEAEGLCFGAMTNKTLDYDLDVPDTSPHFTVITITCREVNALQRSSNFSVRLDLTDMNDNYPQFQNNKTIYFEEKSNYITTLIATDRDSGRRGEICCFSLKGGAVDYDEMSGSGSTGDECLDYLKIDSSTGVVTARRPIDATQVEAMICSISVSDREGKTTEEDFDFRVVDVNEAPSCQEVLFNLTTPGVPGQRLGDSSCADPDIPGTPFSNISYAIQNPEYIRIRNSGEVYLREPLPIGTRSHQTSITATDGGGLTRTFTLKITRPEIVPNCERSEFKVTFEDSMVVGECRNITILCYNSVGGQTYPANLSFLSSPEYATVTKFLNFSEIGAGDKTLFVSACVISSLPRQRNYTLVMNFPGDLTTISASLNVQFTSVNGPPVFTENTTRVFVPKNTTVSSVVHRVIAVDDDAGANGRLNYRLLGTASEPFSINSTSGEITTTQPLQDLAGREFSYEVMVTDNGTPPLSITTMLVLVITDINTPTICMPVYISYLQLNDVVGTVVTQANCSDDDVTRKFQPRIYTITYIGPGISPSLSIDSLGFIRLQKPLTRDLIGLTYIHVDVKDSSENPLTTQTRIPLLITFGDNLVIGEEASRSSDMAPTSRWTAVAAIDGNLATISNTGRDVNSWLMVDLGGMRYIGVVVVINAFGQEEPCLNFTCWQRINPFEVRAGKNRSIFENARCGGLHNFKNSRDYILPINCLTFGRYVSVNTAKAVPESLHVTELQVYRGSKPDCSSTPEVNITLHPDMEIGDCASFRISCYDREDNNYSLTFTTKDNAQYRSILFYFDLQTNQYGAGDLNVTYCLRRMIDERFRRGSKIRFNVSSSIGYRFVNVQFNIPSIDDAPVFVNTPYSSSVADDATVGTTLLAVSAVDTDKRGSTGTLRYQIIDALSSSQTTEYFTLSTGTGQLITARLLGDVQGKRFNITVQAQDTSRLSRKTSTIVTVDIIDVNNPPSCEKIQTISITTFSTISGLAVNLNCSDPDVKPTYRNLSYMLENNTAAHFINVNSAGLVNIATDISLRAGHFSYPFIVTDGGGGRTTTTLHIQVSGAEGTLIMSGQNAGLSRVRLDWSRQPAEFNSKWVTSYTLRLRAARTYSVTLSRDLYRHTLFVRPGITANHFQLFARVRSLEIASNVISIEPPDTIKIEKVFLSLRITSMAWNSNLTNPDSEQYQVLSRNFTDELYGLFENNPAVGKITVLRMIKGSVTIESAINIRTEQAGARNQTNAQLRTALQNGQIGSLRVDKWTIRTPEGGSIAASVYQVSGSSYTGTKVQYQCVATPINSIATGINFTWYIAGARINLRKVAYERIKIVTDPHHNENGTYFSTLIIDPLRPKDAGLLSCHAFGQGSDDIGIANVSLSLLSPPFVSMSPLSLTTLPAVRVTINCTASVVYYGQYPPNERRAVFAWYISGENGQNMMLTNYTGMTISRLSEETTGENEVTVEQLVISSLNDTSTFSCMASSAAGTSRTLTTRINVIEPTDEVCPAMIGPRRVAWQMTALGATDIQDCPTGYEGKAYRFCARDRTGSATWRTPSYSNCISSPLVELVSRSTSLREGVESTTVAGNLKDLARLTENVPAGGFPGGELEGITRVLNDSAEVEENREPGESESSDDTIDEFLSSASNALSLENREDWIELQTSRSGSTALMRAVGTYGKVIARNLKAKSRVKQTLVYNAPNLALEVQYIPTDESTTEQLVVPDKKNLNTSKWVAESSNTVRIPAATLNIASSGENVISISNVIYRTLTEVIPQLLDPTSESNSSYDFSRRNLTPLPNSFVMELSIPSLTTATLNPPIQLQFQHLNTGYTNATCCFWDYDAPYTLNGAWSTRGCKVVTSNSTITICECDHMTNFAILMSPVGDESLDTTAKEVLSYISLIGCSISILCLICTIAIYASVWRHVKSDRAIILMNLCVSLILALGLFLGGAETAIDYEIVCTVVSVLLHFFFLAVFFSMLAEGVLLYMSVVHVFTAQESRAKRYMLLNWLSPLVVVGVSLGVTRTKGYGNERNCWLSLQDGVLYAFVGPALGIILINVVLMILVLRAMFNSTVMKKKTQSEKARSGLWSLCVMMPILGLTWVFGVLSINEGTNIFQYLFAGFNSLQGVFVFIFHCIVSKQVRDALKAKYIRYKTNKESNGQWDSNSTTKTKLQKSKKVKKKYEIDEKKLSKAGPPEDALPSAAKEDGGIANGAQRDVGGGDDSASDSGKGSTIRRIGEAFQKIIDEEMINQEKGKQKYTNSPPNGNGKFNVRYEHIKSNAGNQESPARKRMEKGKLNHTMLGPSDGADISSIRFNQPSFHFRPGYMSDSSSAFSSLSSITGSRIYLPHKNT